MHHFTSTYEDYYGHGMREYPVVLRAMYSIVLAILFAFSKIMWRWDFEDADKLFDSNSERGTVIICNHTSMAEVIAIVAHIWGKAIAYAPFLNPSSTRPKSLNGPFRVWGAFPLRAVHRRPQVSSSMPSTLLQRGEDILILPEGARIRNRRSTGGLQNTGGFAIIASMGKATISPMAVCGFRDLTPKGSKITKLVGQVLDEGGRKAKL